MLRQPLSRRYFQQQYFYVLNERGQLYHLYDPISFIEKNQMPSGPAFLRNKKFLDFFFRNLHVTPRELPHSKLFPFVSKCGKEGNFLAVPDDALAVPVVFTDLINNNNNNFKLQFAGSLTQNLIPSELRECEGRLYHPIGCRENRIFGLEQLQQQEGNKKIDSVSDDTKNNDDDEDDNLFLVHPLNPRKMKIEKEEEEENEGEKEEFFTKASSECCDPVRIEEILKEKKCQNFNKINNNNPAKLIGMGLVSSSVAFEIGFNYISEDETDNNNNNDNTVAYVISLDGGENTVAVKPLFS